MISLDGMGALKHVWMEKGYRGSISGDSGWLHFMRDLGEGADGT